MRAVRGPLVAALVVLLIVVPVVGVWATVHLASAHVVSASDHVARASVPIVTRSIAVSARAEVSVAQSVPSSIAPSPQGGIVTAVEVGAGDVVQQGTELFSIDGVYRVAYVPVSGAALFRDLCKGAVGADVRVLQSLLHTLHLLSGKVDGDFGPATEGAVRRFNRQVGGPRNDGCFHVKSAIPVPAEGAELTGVSLTVGSHIELGGDWASWAPQVTSVDISVDSVSTMPDGAYSVKINGRSLAVEVIGGAARAADPQDFAGLQVEEGSAMLQGALTSDHPVDVQLVPGAAIAVAGDGSWCLRVAQADATAAYVRVDPLPVGFGDQVALSPAASLEGRRAALWADGEASVSTCR